MSSLIFLKVKMKRNSKNDPLTRSLPICPFWEHFGFVLWSKRRIFENFRKKYSHEIPLRKKPLSHMCCAWPAKLREFSDFNLQKYTLSAAMCSFSKIAKNLVLYRSTLFVIEHLYCLTACVLFVYLSRCTVCLPVYCLFACACELFVYLSLCIVSLPVPVYCLFTCPCVLFVYLSLCTVCLLVPVYCLFACPCVLFFYLSLYTICLLVPVYC